MSKKGLKPGLESRPSLVDFYISATKKVFNTISYIHPKYYSLFSVMEDDLRNLGIAPRDYAYTVIGALKKWATSKGLNGVPMKVFCSDFALNKARKILESKTVRTNPEVHDNGTLLHTELMVARAYIARNTSNGDVTRLITIVEELEPLLDQVWVDAYYKGKKRPVYEALDVLMDEYGIRKSVTNYADIVSVLRHGS